MTDNSCMKKACKSIKKKAKLVIEGIGDTVSKWKNFANDVNVDTKLSMRLIKL